MHQRDDEEREVNQILAIFALMMQAWCWLEDNPPGQSLETMVLWMEQQLQQCTHEELRQAREVVDDVETTQDFRGSETARLAEWLVMELTAARVAPAEMWWAVAQWLKTEEDHARLQPSERDDSPAVLREREADQPGVPDAGSAAERVEARGVGRGGGAHQRDGLPDGRPAPRGAPRGAAGNSGGTDRFIPEGLRILRFEIGEVSPEAQNIVKTTQVMSTGHVVLMKLDFKKRTVDWSISVPYPLPSTPPMIHGQFKLPEKFSVDEHWFNETAQNLMRLMVGQLEAGFRIYQQAPNHG